jgi:hypothetical protein
MASLKTLKPRQADFGLGMGSERLRYQANFPEKCFFCIMHALCTLIGILPLFSVCEQYHSSWFPSPSRLSSSLDAANNL